MKYTIALAAALTASVIAAPQAHANEARATTKSIVKVIPGGGNVFQNGDPIRICAGTETSQIVTSAVKMSIDFRSDREGAKWKSLYFDIQPNTVGCLFAAVKGHGDVQIRSRTYNNSEVLGSASRKVTITVQP